MPWPVDQRAKIVELFLKHGSVVAAQRAFRRETGLAAAPSANTIKKYVARFRGGGNVGDRTRYRQRPARSMAVKRRIARAVESQPLQSIRALAKRVNKGRTTVHRILTEDMALYPYKVQLTQKLRLGDKARRLEWCHWLLKRPEEFRGRVWMTDEAKFHLDGTVSKQNCRYWSQDNPQLTMQRDLYPPSVTVWCAISARGIVGPFFFWEEGESVTVTAKRYAAMLENFFIPSLTSRGESLRQAWFQQDGATPHVAKSVLQLLKRTFKGRVISKAAAVPWPPRSPDLTAPDFFLWGLVKSNVYSKPVPSLLALKKRIARCIRAIPIADCKAAMDSLPGRCLDCIRHRGGHLDTVVFHV